MHFIRRNKYVQQVIFWGITFFLLRRIFTRDQEDILLDVLFSILFLLPLLMLFYTNYWLVHQYLIKKRIPGYYLVGFIGITGLGVLFHYFVFNYLSDVVFPSYYLTTYFDVVELIEIFVGFSLLTALLFLSRNWFFLKEKELTLEKENHQVKVAALKAQINPHFLFNSLNNIYAFSNPENKSVRNYLVKLSDALRYMIYDAAEELVPLEEEIAYVTNYFSLEKLRFDDADNIQLQLDGDFSGRLIAPLLLLTVVENCFKHCKRTAPFIDIQLTIKEEIVVLKTINNLSAQEEKKKGGMGIQNLCTRLNLLYANQHIFRTKEEAEQYHCQLQINLAQ